MYQPLFLALVCVFPIAVAAQEVDVLTPSGDLAPLRAVKLIQPNEDALSTARVFFGQIAAKETVDLSFVVGGRITMFDAQEGEFLEDDMQIAALDLAPFERAVERVTLQLSQAERDLVRVEKLASSNAVAETQAADARTARDLAAIALREAQDALDDATLHAPFRALVASRLTPNFANVSPGQPVVRVHDMSEVRVEIDVPERLFQQSASNGSVRFTGASPSFDGDVPLELREFNAETQNIGQSFRVTLALPADQITPGIIPGSSMTVTARTEKIQSAVMVLPPSAVAIEGGQAKVMLFTPDADGDTGTVSWTPVQLGSTTGTNITVMGLSADALVVAAGAHLLRDGEIVRRFTGLNLE